MAGTTHSTSSDASAAVVDHPQDRATTLEPSCASNAPDWNLVHFSVGCARCGQDLRGLTEPVCPACSLAFDWSEAVPLEELTCTHCGYHLYGLSETRCPECGNTFTWDEVLTAYHRTRSPFFEYRYRARPVRSFFRAFADSLRPKWLWSTISLHDPPRVGALFLLWFGCAAFMVGVPAVLGFGFTRLVAILQTRVSGWPAFFWNSSQPYDVVDAAFAVLASAAWVGIMFLTLASMHWSLKACRVRRAHVLRVCMYLPPLVAPLPAMLYVMMFMGDVLVVRDWVTQQTAYAAVTAASLLGVVAFLVFSIVHIGFAYKRYIGMRHAWGVAIAASLAASIAALTVLSWRILFG